MPHAVGLRSATGSWACFLVPTNSTVPPSATVLAHEPVRGVDAVERLLQIDDVDAVALAEDEPLHLRVPAPGLVTEVDTGLQQLLHGDDGHGRASLKVAIFRPRERRPQLHVGATSGSRAGLVWARGVGPAAV